MPFTPFHLGPAALCKAVAGRHFSFLVFAGAQVLMDIEPGVRMLVGSDILHGPSHTVIGAVLIGTIATLVGKPVSELALSLTGTPAPSISWLAAASGAFIGTFSHIVLDAIMHADMLPWAPFNEDNPLLGLVSLPTLHTFCLVCGILGAVAWFFTQRTGEDNNKE